ncbi:hypothetical protein FQZ97_586800 [compost metagenome]
MAPLATPVVPPVYCSTAMSSRPTRTGFSAWPWPRFSASLNDTAWGRWKSGTIFFTFFTRVFTSQPLRLGSMSPMRASIRYSIPVSGSTSSTSLPNRLM